MGIRGLNESSSSTAAVAGLTAVLGSQPQGAQATVQERLRIADRADTRGLVVFTWDDGYASHDTVATMASDRGQRHTFAITSGLIGSAGRASWGQVASLAEAGHEIAAHSVDHSNIAGLTTAQRIAQYDDSKAAIEAVIGAGTVRSWVYPFGGTARTNTTDRELYLRYDRIIDTGPTLPVWKGESSDDFLIRRFTWNTDTRRNAELLDRIRQAADSPVIVSIYAHDLGALNEPTLAQVETAMDLAHSLGVPCVTTADAFPVAQRITNPGFESVDGSSPMLPVAWNIDGRTDSNQIIEVVNDTPMLGFPGTRSLHIQTNGDTRFAYARQVVPVQPSTHYTLSFRYRTSVTGAGSGGCYARLQEYNYDNTGSILATTQTSALSSGSWAAGSQAFTTNAQTRFVNLDFLVNNQTAEFWVDHVDLRPTRYGSFG